MSRHKPAWRLLAGCVIACCIPTTIFGDNAQAPPPKSMFFPQPSLMEAKIVASFQQKTDMQFTQTPLVDALQFLRDFHQVPIWIDQRSLTEAGVDVDSPVTLELSGVTFRSGLRLLLEPLELVAVVEDDVLKITTATYLQSHQRTRVYPVADLAESAEELKSLASAIENGLAGARWNQQQDGGTVTPVTGPRALVVRQTLDVHDKLVELLDSLRAVKQAIPDTIKP